MVRLGMVALVAVGIIAQSEIASSAELSNHSRKQVINRGSVNLPLRSARSREQVTHRSQPRDTSRAAKEHLFRDFQDWLKNLWGGSGRR
jgi:hypothetical protein